MAIKDLEARQGNVDLIMEIVEKSEPREFEKFGNTGRVCNCKGKDETGTITMTLWNDDIDKVTVGNKVHITNGWVSEWQGELQLSTGKFGKLEVVDNGSAETADESVKKPVNEAVEEDLVDNPSKTEDEKVEEELLEELGAEEETIEESVTEDEKSGN
ncbi:MAG: hypothetical protein U9R34_07305 [Nanoarchaeota archaeon]|nr:hypothetical protein [Nanoarchaeota archaeon]